MNARSIRIWSWLALLMLGLAAVSTAPAAWAGQRIALVIGNGDYQSADKLANPVTDARHMRDTLARIGFTVIYGENLDKRTLERTIGRFAGATQDAEVALVYYAGHGATFGETPYIVPVDARFTSLDEMPYELVPVETLIGELRRAKGVRIAILDACRDDAAERQLKKTASRGGEITRGLQRIKNPEGLILAYATQYLDTAADGPPDGDSPFTTALLRNIVTPGLDVKTLFFKVGGEVIEETQGRQRPEVSISFFGNFSLVDDSAPPVMPAPQAVVPAPQPAVGAPQPIVSRSQPAIAPPQPLVAASQPVVVAPPQSQVPQRPPEARVARLEAGLDPAVDACDRLAAAPLDPSRPSERPGVEFERLDPTLAVPACRGALAVQPDNPRIAFQLGRALQKGGGEDVEAAALFRKAAEAGDANGMNNLGLMFQNGRGLPQDDIEAVRWFRKAVEAGSLYGMDNLGFRLKAGKGVPQDDVAAFGLFRRAAEGGNPNGMNNLGIMYDKGRGVAQDDIQAAIWFRKAAEAGNAHGMNNVGVRYKTGKGLPKDEAEAVRWFRQASDAGDSGGMNNLALMYEAGHGVPKDYDAAIAWYRRAGDAGNSNGWDNLGSMYEAGRGVPPDAAEALRLFRKAADAGNARAMNHLGVMAREGIGGPRDPAEASRNFRAAADAGNVDAMINLGRMIQSQKGVAGNDAEAASWFRKAADAGNGDAMVYLGLMYRSGRGVARDNTEALRWFRKAEGLGSTLASTEAKKRAP